ncbi:hypothetical protein SAMN05421770_10419 [Granulicella rosea]|uniref:Uncharacterized protein n=1 Tax=Granulicella rosea TaxID=474952 RepID=A0A239JLH1_9BACT|nr:hypothetical protein [Granulicella rosea]SNT06707.1 hypothetical protein SAMN05421770_10419 [Granulicella rosea]
MQIELSEDLRPALEKKAADAGMSVASYANLIMQEQILLDADASSRRIATIDAWIQQMKSNEATSGRGAQEWRSFIHEGHAY